MVAVTRYITCFGNFLREILFLKEFQFDKPVNLSHFSYFSGLENFAEENGLKIVRRRGRDSQIKRIDLVKPLVYTSLPIPKVRGIGYNVAEVIEDHFCTNNFAGELYRMYNEYIENYPFMIG